MHDVTCTLSVHASAGHTVHEYHGLSALWDNRLHCLRRCHAINIIFCFPSVLCITCKHHHYCSPLREEAIALSRHKRGLAGSGAPALVADSQTLEESKLHGALLVMRWVS